MRRIVAACTAAVTVHAALCTGLAPAAPIREGRYVALGSSYAAGPGLTPVIDQGCLRSSRNYPHQLAEALGLDLVDVTCSGATTANILDKPQQLRGGRSVPAQIQAVTPDTRLVTITIGGNDLGLIGTMIDRSCGAIQAACAAVVGRPTQPIPEDFASVEQSIAKVVRTVQSSAPRARVLLVNYLPVLDSAADTCPQAPLGVEDAIGSRRAFEGLISATRAAAATAGVTTVGISDAEDHTVCAREPWTFGFHNPITTGSSGTESQAGIMGTFGSSYHPNPVGTMVIAGELAHILSS
ncbi:SGNH/GDSL hydrolase family protein [Nocardia sp. NPDC004260]